MMTEPSKTVSDSNVGEGGGLSGNFKERTEIDDLVTVLPIKFEHQDKLLERVGVANPEAPLLWKIRNVSRN